MTLDEDINKARDDFKKISLWKPFLKRRILNKFDSLMEKYKALPEVAQSLVKVLKGGKYCTNGNGGSFQYFLSFDDYKENLLEVYLSEQFGKVVTTYGADIANETIMALAPRFANRKKYEEGYCLLDILSGYKQKNMNPHNFLFELELLGINNSTKLAVEMASQECKKGNLGMAPLILELIRETAGYDARLECKCEKSDRLTRFYTAFVGMGNIPVMDFLEYLRVQEKNAPAQGFVYPGKIDEYWKSSRQAQDKIIDTVLKEEDYLKQQRQEVIFPLVDMFSQIGNDYTAKIRQMQSADIGNLSTAWSIARNNPEEIPMDEFYGLLKGALDKGFAGKWAKAVVVGYGNNKDGLRMVLQNAA